MGTVRGVITDTGGKVVQQWLDGTWFLAELGSVWGLIRSILGWPYGLH